jgi:hypothetical protein
MRLLLCVVLSILGLLAMETSRTLAADGCSYDAYGQLYCERGARPGVPYYRDYDYGPRRYGYGPQRQDLRYYCSLGSQTPHSLRAQCRRLGYW